ncbi:MULTISPECIES: hypothetical protein [unclassified Streptomyces]|uniref:hypothetical protein n=1 Tax=unclassified Streptomyces TaxID=2593676 RepID=UPI00137152D4|nr:MULTISPECIES: hypothetical protein [unclassified Streptomyces]NDZ98558.1 hypothetical protein [Streptomyces sp. SID10116]MYY79716.1 hypothetical protein [Streptomyces sp. SID335]MYZ12810.1 hypothetical protein [Streptomyces sp. SID337]NDZ84547.1 hypothetical protein [Streptomyces sp. SID10115]NEB43511.1 hypothetical protein [Streptomyces sp. SID339]
MTARQPVRWMPDERSRQILAAFAARKERMPSVLRRALELLAQADGVVDHRGKVKTSGRQP